MMDPVRSALPLAIAVGLAAACSSGVGPAPDDGGVAGGDGAPSMDGDAPGEGPAEPDAPLPLGMTGVRAFDATFSGLSGSVQVSTSAFTSKTVSVSPSQTFALVLDFDRGFAYVRHQELPLTKVDGKNYRVANFSLQTKLDEAAVTYEDVTFAIEGDALSGGAFATASSYVGFEQPNATVHLGGAALTGGPDVTPPGIWTFGLPAGDFDPWSDWDFFVSEALRPSSVARLVGSLGDSYVWKPDYAGASGHSVAFFENPGTVLRYGSTYHVDPTTMVDFAGNQLAPLEFKTPPAPSLVASAKNIVIPIGCDERSPTRTALRLSIPTGGRSVHVVCRGTTSAPTTFTLLVGVEGQGPITPWSQLVTADAVAADPLLPAGATTEVMVALSATQATCPAPSTDTVIVDEVVVQ